MYYRPGPLVRLYYCYDIIKLRPFAQQRPYNLRVPSNQTMTSEAYKLPLQLLYNLIAEAGVVVESIFDGQDVVPIGNLTEFKDTALSVDSCSVKVTHGSESGSFDLVFWGVAPDEIIGDYCAPGDSQLLDFMDDIFNKFEDYFAY